MTLIITATGQQAEIDEVKTCPRCTVEKPLSEFHKNLQKANGKSVYCKTCMRLQANISRQRYIEKPDARERIKCSHCKQIKLPGEFNKKKGSITGFNNYCKNCEKLRKAKMPKPPRLPKEERVTPWKTNYDKRDQARVNSRRHHLKKYFGITLEQYDEIATNHNGRCGICGINFEDKRPHLDHNHATGEIRGLICSNCNHGLGHFKDSIANLQKAIDYLKEHGGTD